MLLPFQWAVLTVQEARTLADFIRKTTATKSRPLNFDKMQELGVLDVFRKLDEFVGMSEHYESQLRYLEQKDFQQRGSCEDSRW